METALFFLQVVGLLGLVLSLMTAGFFSSKLLSLAIGKVACMLISFALYGLFFVGVYYFHICNQMVAGGMVSYIFGLTQAPWLQSHLAFHK